MATYTWVGGSGGPAKKTSWNTKGNWNPATAVPGAGDDVIIAAPPPGGSEPILDTSTQALNSLTIKSGATLTVPSTFTLNVTGTPGISVLGTLAVTGGTVSATSGVTVGAGGTLSGYGAVSAITLGGGTITQSGGSLSLASITGYGTVNGTPAVTGAVTANGGVLALTANIGNSSGLAFDIANTAGSVLKFNGTVGSGNTVTFNGNAGVLELSTASISPTSGLTVSGLSNSTSGNAPTGNYINVQQGTIIITSVVFGGGGQNIQLLNGSTVLETITLGTAVDPTHTYVDWATDTSLGGTDIFLSDVACFATGTRILTPAGERAVETLAEGEAVLTLFGEGLSARPIRWVGRRRIDLTAHKRPETVAPIRIKRGAFADNVPHHDLLVSPDHAIFVDSKLICARQLINGATIRQEQDWTSVEYFHVELDAHAILLAEGLTAESYLDTGNRGFFANSGAPLTLHPDLTDEVDYPAREAHSVAPFVWDEENVRPIWQRLADRADALGQALPQVDATADPELRVLAKGRRLKPLHSENGLYIFALPSRAETVQILSRASVPTDARPWLEDRRLLGVYVEAITLRGADGGRAIALDDPALLRGWWAVERDGLTMRRWTDGQAVLQLPECEGRVMLEIRAGNGDMMYALSAEEVSQVA